MISHKKDLNNDNDDLGSERDVLNEIDSFHRSDLVDQHVHVYARAVQNLRTLRTLCAVSTTWQMALAHS